MCTHTGSTNTRQSPTSDIITGQTHSAICKSLGVATEKKGGTSGWRRGYGDVATVATGFNGRLNEEGVPR